MLALAIPKAVSVLAAGDFHEKSKVAFYILAGLLAAWALFISFAGLRQPEFPNTRQLSRGVMGISVALPVATATAAVLTASVPRSVPPFNNSKSPVNGQKGQVTPATPPASAAAPAAGATGTSGAAVPGAPPKAAAAPRTTQIAADPSGQLAFVQKSVTLKAGTDTIRFVNQAPLAHNLTIQRGAGATGPSVGATPTFTGASRTLSVRLSPGTYTFYCSVPGHRQAGMQGTLTVQ